ncbi:MAG: carboxypeptidase-like regulatory domain-containing protein [Bryobacteraceae bacterium]|nr:carboxypeptidase-like regulatory domain-containing protein [Bryobacteraceae bacterium]
MLALAASCFAQAPTPEPSLAGTVRDRVSGQGLAGVTVTVKKLVGPDDAVASTSTAGNGTYHAAVRPGICRLTFERKGYRTRAFGGKTGAVPEPVVIAEGSHAKGLDVAMAPLSSMAGRVTDEDGEPVGEAAVHLLARRTLLGGHMVLSERTVKTSATGEYRIEDVPDGSYYLGVVPPKRRRPSGGRPTADEQGYVVTYYPRITHLDAAPPIRVDAGEDRAGIDVRLKRSRDYEVRGTVAGHEMEARDLILSLQAAQGESLTAVLLPSVPLTPDLRFEFWDVPPGRYVLVARSKRSIAAPWAKVLIEVAAQDVTDVQVQLVPPFTASGRITAVPESFADSVKMEWLRVSLRAVEGLHVGPPLEGRVSADGSFTVGDVSAGRYHVTVRGLPEGG